MGSTHATSKKWLVTMPTCGMRCSIQGGVMKTLIFILATMTAVTSATAAEPDYHLLQTIQISPAKGIFDYVAVDPVNRRVYLSHSEEVVVLDADSNAVVGRIPGPDFDPTYGIGVFGR